MDVVDMKKIDELVMKYWSIIVRAPFNGKEGAKESTKAFFKLKGIFELSKELGYDVESNLKTALRDVREWRKG